MCLFPKANTNYTGEAFRKGLREFACGHCPECLSTSASRLALLGYAESHLHLNNCMITLTYDNYERDDRGRLLSVEKSVDPTIELSKRHIQLFLKRLRKWYHSAYPDAEPIKYLCGAEYGSHTHRAHYHLILFGVAFPDLVFYKLSKRRNPIYKSQTLTSLWGHGICTVDDIHITAANVRYVCKYTAKTRSPGTFQLRSTHLGERWLDDNFNGLYYLIDGHYYSIPRTVWCRYITLRYGEDYTFDYHYVNLKQDGSNFDEYLQSKQLRSVYRAIRDSDAAYSSYLNFWRNRAIELEAIRPSIPERIDLLPSKFTRWKTRAKLCYEANLRALDMRYFPDPVRNSVTTFWSEHIIQRGHLPLSSCQLRASDTKYLKDIKSQDFYVLMLQSEQYIPEYFCNPFVTQLRF